ncbi:hypothetical protein CN568_24165 [Bacillus pseudomycoides]|uniref:hypothetical protein n=1 Tax=Bacillus pseudomycoides TaxID=64104 RepID=UPI000BEFD928|nr:hypothetical protein [Bacillus pseudomycoides]PEK39642.1 hypothetical protein CN691_02600 [Bacillus pseudomycoides]PEK66395.1 hypothetical protein CN593_18155 [Bacillus pseudomycoides]PEP38735.1 hypothetical protein CN568_24165 [Bacillus pseudomycoides]PEP40656.1 hypothetical protein CN565_16290 [Bacillus pseudomycoides]PFX44322.1 hypothetical protein COL31_26945 [Bacillus pseudomycoides]
MWDTYKLKLLSKADWTPDKSDLDHLHTLTGSRNIYIYTDLEAQSEVFNWRTIIDIEIDQDIYNSQKFSNSISSDKLVLEYGLDFLMMKSASFSKGKYQEGADVIVSFYSWAHALEESEREKALWEHFNMEKDQPYYSLVNFNAGVNENNSTSNPTDFMFEGFVGDPEGLSEIYRSPFLNKMRIHSKLFLNTDTRQLAFGKLHISRLDG